MIIISLSVGQYEQSAYLFSDRQAAHLYKQHLRQKGVFYQDDSPLPRALYDCWKAEKEELKRKRPDST